MKSNLLRRFNLFTLQRIDKLLYIFPLCGIVLAVANIWSPYSFWLDELISVTTSRLGLPQMFEAILQDVHPPLYQLMLWIWMRIFGDSELAVRVPSLIFSLWAFAYLALWTRKLDSTSRVGILIFFSSSFLFAYYAQEARSYAMLLLCSTLLTTRFLDFDSRHAKLAGMAALCLLTSLTHYFGLILALVILAWIGLDNRRNLPRLTGIAVLGSVLLVWPLVHRLIGAIGNKSGGHFWIKVDGPLGTLSIVRDALWPMFPFTATQGIGSYATTAITIVGLCLMTLFLALWPRNKDGEFSVHKQYFGRLAFLSCGVIVLTTVVDLHTPVSTIRNYIVLLPAAAIFFGLAVSGLCRFPRLQVICVFFLIACGTSRLYDSYNALVNKWWTRENWKESSAFLVNNSNPNLNYYYLPFDESEDMNATLDRVNNFYVNKLSGGRIILARITSSESGKLRKPFAILFGHVDPDFIKRNIAVDPNFGTFSAFYPAQGSKKSTGVIVSAGP